MTLLREPRAVLRLTLVALTAGSLAVGAASLQNVSEPALKAAFVLNFAKFTEWPEDALPANAPLVVCSADEAVSPALEGVITGHVVPQHPLVLTRVSLDDTLTDCAVLYVGRLERQQAVQLVTRLRGRSVLTVGDEQAFTAAGGIIGLFLEGGRMRFAINISAAERGRLRLSTKLLSLARIVKD